MKSDLFNLPNKGPWQVHTFEANDNIGGTCWHTWFKPQGISQVFIFALAGGGGGGNGFIATNGNARGGGSGGGSSAFQRLWVPAFLLPDTLYISVGFGGAATTIGIASYVSPQPVVNGTFALITTQPGTGGVDGTNSGSQTGGPGGTNTTPGASVLGLFTAVAGNSGTNGATASAAAGNNGSSIALAAATFVVTGGTGGGGGTGSAGNINKVGVSQIMNLDGGVGGASPTNGKPGIRNDSLLLFYGGTGGGSTNTATTNGGNGGDGNYGCGGGGGGGGTQAGGSIGGRGGNGIVYIVSF